MATRPEDHPKGTEKKEPKIRVRDLTTKKDAIGGAQRRENQKHKPAGGTEEIDFMTDFHW